jgi:phytoene synthase
MTAAAAAPERGSSFAPAFLILPPAQRRALSALYGFCRAVDDAADESPTPEEARRRLAEYRAALDGVYGQAPAPDAAALPGLAEAVRAFPIRRADLEAVIEGCGWDVEPARYVSWSDLRAYCLRVASAVGLAAIEIFGYRSPHTRDYAVELGLALQLTNIVRDIDEDAMRGRIYLPVEDLAAFGVSEDELLDPSYRARRPEALRRLLRFEAQRARVHYARARGALSRVERARLLPAEIMGDVYHALLLRLEALDFPPGRVSLHPLRKGAVALRRLVAAMWIRLAARIGAPRFARAGGEP